MTGNHSTLSAFVLAGGRSRRMGRDKARLPWGQGTLLDHMVGTLRGVAATVSVVGRDEWPDGHPGRGPVEGIRTALEITTTEDNLIVAVDLPFVPPALLTHLAARLRVSAHGLVVCRVDGRIPVCMGVKRGLLPNVNTYLEAGKRAVEGLADTIAHDTVGESDLGALGVSSDVFSNLNSPDDYASAHREAFG